MSLKRNPEKPSSVPIPEQSPDIRETGENKAELEPKQAVDTGELPKDESAPISAAPVVLPSASPRPVKDTYHQQVEQILEDGLKEIYMNIPEDKRPAFRAEGERVASQLRQMVDSTKIKVKEVMELIMNWLKMIPGVNRWFLEQEAKIKADRIIRLAEDRRNQKDGI